MPQVEREKRLSYGNRLRSLSFGRNGADDVNTCSAIATGLALNCLAWVENDMKSEPLVGDRWNPTAYPNTQRLQRHLIDECGLSPRYFFRKFTLGVWGGKIIRGCKRHSASMTSAPSDASDDVWHGEGAGGEVGNGDGKSGRKSIRIKLHVGPGLGKRVRAAIDADSPAMITTAWNRFEKGTFNTHTMLVYGYRRSPEGVWEYLVHPGWYGKAWIDARARRAKEVWVPSRIAVMGYWFAADAESDVAGKAPAAE